MRHGDRAHSCRFERARVEASMLQLSYQFGIYESIHGSRGRGMYALHIGHASPVSFISAADIGTYKNERLHLSTRHAYKAIVRASIFSLAASAFARAPHALLQLARAGMQSVLVHGCTTTHLGPMHLRATCTARDVRNAGMHAQKAYWPALESKSEK